MKNGDKYFYIMTSLPDRQSFQIQLPHGLECWHCIIQWTYVAGEVNKQYLLKYKVSFLKCLSIINIIPVVNSKTLKCTY